MEIGCSEVNVMVQECRYDKQKYNVPMLAVISED